MSWEFKKEFYGKKEKLSLRTMKEYLQNGYYYIPHTLFKGYYKAVYKTGGHDDVYTKTEKPFPDALTAQNPNRKFALHLSGGFDSSVLAKLYDREDADYIHFVGPETPKVRVLAATLKGKLHEIEITPEEFINTAEEIVPLLREPYPYQDVVFAYIASKKAKALGHNLIVTGDGGDVAFGGSTVGPDSAEACDIWKTLEPNRLLELATLQPFMHTSLLSWAKETLNPDEVISKTKPFLSRYCKELGMPKEIVCQKKVPWAGSLGIMGDNTVINYLQRVVDNSEYAWIKDVRFQTYPKGGLLFRQYSMVKWLENNYKKKIEKSESRILLKEIGCMNKMEILVRDTKKIIKRFLPDYILNMIRRFKNV